MEAFPHISDQTGDVWSAFDVSSQPAFVFINDEGTVVARTGSLGDNGIDERIEELIAS